MLEQRNCMQTSFQQDKQGRKNIYISASASCSQLSLALTSARLSKSISGSFCLPASLFLFYDFPLYGF